MCVCVYTYIHIHTYIHTYIHTHTHTHTHTRTHSLRLSNKLHYINNCKQCQSTQDGSNKQLIKIRMFNRNRFLSGVSIIPVITLFSLKAKARRCLKYADCNHLELRNQDRKVDSSNSLKIFHQNTSRLRNKPDESIPKNR